MGKKVNIKKICTVADCRNILNIEGEIVLRFTVNPLENKVLRNTRDESGTDASKEKVDELVAKCEITTISYSSGLVIKKIKVVKEIDNRLEEARQKMISEGVVDVLGVILKAVRKFKRLAYIGRNKYRDKLIAPYPGKDPRSKQSLSSVISSQGLQSNSHLLPIFCFDRCNSINSSGYPFSQPGEGVIPNPTKIVKKSVIMNAAEKMATNNLVVKEIVDGRLTEALKQVRKIRRESKNINTSFSIECLRKITYLFILLVLSLLTIRIGISIFLNSKVVNYAPLMYHNGVRVVATGYIGLCAESLSLYYNYSSFGKTLIDETIRSGRYNYSELLHDIGLESRINSLKDFYVIYMKHNIQLLNKAQLFINNRARDFPPESANLINPPAVTLDYTINNQSSNYTLPMNGATEKFPYFIAII